MSFWFLMKASNSASSDCSTGRNSDEGKNGSRCGRDRFDRFDRRLGWFGGWCRLVLLFFVLTLLLLVLQRLLVFGKLPNLFFIDEAIQSADLYWMVRTLTNGHALNFSSSG